MSFDCQIFEKEGGKKVGEICTIVNIFKTKICKMNVSLVHNTHTTHIFKNKKKQGLVRRTEASHQGYL